MGKREEPKQKEEPKGGRVVKETPPPDAGGPPLRNRPANLPHDLVRGDREPK